MPCFLPPVLSDFDNSILILMGCDLTVAQLASPQWQGWELISACYLLFMYLLYWSVYEYLVQFLLGCLPIEWWGKGRQLLKVCVHFLNGTPCQCFLLVSARLSTLLMIPGDQKFLYFSKVLSIHVFFNRFYLSMMKGFFLHKVTEVSESTFCILGPDPFLN